MGARVPIAREITRTRQGDKIQTNAAKTARAFNANPHNAAVTIYGVIFKPGTNTYVAHGLGRTPVGYAWVNYRKDPAQANPTGPFGCERNTTDDPSNDETRTLSLGPWQPGIADVEVW